MNPYNSDIALGILVGSICAIFGTYLTHRNDNLIPKTEQVQQGYIAPSKLEIKCKDLDENGEPETILRIGDKSYLLREVDGKPVISAYEIKPINWRNKPAFFLKRKWNNFLGFREEIKIKTLLIRYLNKSFLI